MATTTSVSPATVERNTSRRTHNNSIPSRSQSTRVKSSTTDSPQRSHSHSHHHRPSSRHAALEESIPQANYETANVAQQSRKTSSRDGPTPSRHESTRSATSNHRSTHHSRQTNDMATAAANGGGPAPVVTPQESRNAAHRGKSRTTIPAQSGNWILGKTIGQGSMGKVKLARQAEGGEQVAVKIVPRGSTDDNHNQSRADRERADHSKEVRTAREAAIVTLLNHPYICGMRDVVRTTYHWYMLFEYVNGGQMLDYIISHGRLKEKQARKFSRQIASALDYCHRNSIVHRDLKIENILISKTGDIKIIDFGLSNLFAPRNHLKTFCGSLYFAAPELLQAKAYTGPEVDVWSFGIVLYVLVCGKVPFDDQSMPALHAKIKRGIVDYPNWLSPECKHLISRMLVTDPKQRATLQEIMTHQWMIKQYGSPPENYLPVREPLTLPLDDDIINSMTGFDFGPPELIKQQLTDVIKSAEYGHAVRLAMQERENSGPPRDAEKKRGVFDFYKRRNSTTSRDTLTAPSAELLQLGNDPCNAYHPLISVYYLVKEKRERDALEANPGATSMPRAPGEAPLQVAEISAPKPAYTNATAYEMPGEKATGGRSRPRARTHGEEEVTEGLKNMKIAGSTGPPSPAIVEPVEQTARKESTAAGILRRFSTRRRKDPPSSDKTGNHLAVGSPNEPSAIRKSFSVRRHRERDGEGSLRASGSERQHSDLLTPRSAENSGASKLGRSTSVNSAEYRRRENTNCFYQLITMAPFEKKRKTGPTNDSFMRSKKASESDDRPSKRPRAGEKEGTSTSTTKLPPATKISRPKEEEVAFPRGGASVLTPLEHKQIQIDATRDVLFEQYGAKPSKPDGEVQEGEDTSKVKKKGKGKGKGKKAAQDTDVEEEAVKIEGLSYKRLVPGSLVLGQVSQINATDIALSLPNNLTGYVPITSISDKATERIEAIAAAEEDDVEDELEVQDIDLKKMFSMGQYLRAYVVSTSDDTNTATLGKGKRRIELSLRPQHANNAVTSQNLIANTTLMASVTSVEDHGLIMNIGLEDSGIRGFMGAKDIGHEVVLADVQEGAVFLCMVTGLSSNGKTVKLCADTQKIGNLKKSNYLTDAPTVDAFLPGTAVEILIVDVSSRGVTGKVMGMVDVTADLMHSGTGVMNQELEKKFKIGAKVRGRVICTFPNSDPQKLGVSLLDHVASLSPQQAGKPGNKVDPLDALPLSAIIEEVTIKKVESGVGLFVDVGVKGIPGFVHISRVKDGKIETLEETTGPYKVGSVHRGRVLAYNSLDGVYLVSLEKSVLEQAYLRIEDLKVGEVVKGKVEKLIVNANGFGGLLVNLAENISGLVPETHLADVQLLHPEKKFKEGMSVTARVLSTDPGKRQIRLTLKKTLVNSESPAFTSYDGIIVGMQSPGTIVNIMNTGAVVQFYGNIRGFLPVSEMSEAYIQDPSQHFKVGQVVNVHVLKVDPESQKLTVSCKDPSVFGLAQQNALKNLKIGEILSALVIEKSNDDISVEIQGLGLKATLPVGHLTDGSENKSRSSFKNIRVGQVLTDLAVLDKHEQRRLIVLTNKPALVKAAQSKTLLRLFDDVKKDRTVHGFVKNITLTAVFVQFGGGLTGLLPKNMIPEKNLRLPDFGFKKWQTVEVKVIKIDNGLRRFLLSLADATSDKKPQESLAPGTNQDAVNPVDETIKSIDDITLGRLTKARISSVKDTQVNVQLADNIQGRIDVSQAFDSWSEIKSKKQPLKSFSPKQIIDVRVLGIHDARNHRFLPISHRSGKTLVFELSAKPSDQTEAAQDPVSLDKIKLGSSWLAFVNNVGADCLWVNLSPNVRGRISALDVSDDVSLLKDLEANFPIGSAIRVHVKGVDVETNRLDLSARSSQDSEALTFDRLSKGMIVPGKVTRVNERQVMVQITDSISAPINLTDLCDDFSEADPSKYSKNDIVRVCVTDLDIPNKRVRLSTRASRVMNSSAAVQDAEISSISQLKVNDIVRGFVKHVADKGLFVNLGGNVTAYVRISDLSDSYIKDWKSEFQVDQLVKGKVTVVDEVLNHIQLSLKPSVIDKDYIAPLTFNDIHVGQVITGKIRKVEDFGVFIVVDGSANVSGLCHQSEMAEKRVHDVKKLYSDGDEVKAIVLKMDPEKKRISFSMKASHFEDGEESDDGSEDDGVEGVKLDNMDLDDNDDESEGGVEFDDVQDLESATEDADEAFDSDEEMQDVGDDVPALSAGGFDWSADILNQADGQSNADSEEECVEEKPKKNKRKAEIKIDRTGDLDANGPQSVSDFERLLLGQPDSSSLWTQYMAFQMQLSELGKAREVAERAIKTINMREETEKLNIWLALLNLEIAYGNDETVEEVFKRACQYNDAQEVHERLASIYIQSGKNEKADELFQTLTKKFSQSPTVWVNYAHFLFNTLGSPDRGRALLARATQSLPPHTHLPLTLKFAALEFRSEHGSPERGRTIFEGVLAKWSKRLDIWGQLLDLEIKAGDAAIARGIFERVTRIKGLKPKGAKGWFKRWSEWEEVNGDKKSQERVRAIAEEWVRSKSERKDDQD